MIGRLYLRLRQTLEKIKYDRILNNGTDTFNQNALSNSKNNTSIINGLSFRNGPIFSIRDGLSAGHAIKEIFLNKCYSQGTLLQALKKANIVFDVGANIGLFSYYVLRNTDKAHLYCFEADPLTFEILNSNIQKLPDNLIKRTTLDNYAVSNFQGYIPFYSSKISSWSSCYKMLGAENGNMVNVESILLSDYLKNNNIEQVDFLKIDVEGSEYDILIGDKNLLEHNIRVIVVEADLKPRNSKYKFNDLLEILKAKYGNVEINSKNGSNYPLIYCSSRY